MTPKAKQALVEFQSYRAFRMWFRQTTGGNLDVCAQIIFEMARDSSGGIAWLLLTATGDATFTAETFRRAAGIALDTPEREEK